jgi:hypothetical protein
VRAIVVHGAEAVVVLALIGLLIALELLRARTDLAGKLTRHRLARVTLFVAAAFVLVIERRFFDIAT